MCPFVNGDENYMIARTCDNGTYYPPYGLTACPRLSCHRPVNVKRAVIGSKGGWKLSTIFLSCKVFHDWSIIKLRNILYLLDGSFFAVLFGTTSHC